MSAGFVLRNIILCMVVCQVNALSAQADYLWLRSADVLYQNRTYIDAETAYRKAQEEQDRPTTSYNLGNTIYQQQRIPEAITQYQKSIESTKDPELKSRAWYNLGNAHYQNKEFDKSIEAYKESLKLMPQDEDAKKNLMLAMQQLKQQQQQQQQQNKDQQDQNKDQQQQQQNQQQQQDQQQQQNQQQQNQPESRDQQQEQAQDLSKDEAKEILKAVEREDQRVQEKLKKASSRTAPPVKDW